MTLTQTEKNTIIDALRYYCGANDFESPLFFDPPPLVAYADIKVLADRLSGQKRHSPGRPPLHADKVEALREMREDGRTIKEITETLHMGRTTAYRWLRK